MRWLAALALLGACTEQMGATGTIEQAVTYCPTDRLEGVDIYDGTGTIDWTMVAGAGRTFAFIKATQGDYNKQTKFGANWTNAKAAGILRSAYHFFDPSKDGVAQAHWFLDALAAQGGLQPGDLPPMLDIECPTSSVKASASANCEYAGNSGWVEPATMKQRIFDWLDTVEQATGTKAFLYSYPSWFAGVTFTDTKLADYPLYIASYNSCATVPAPWTTAVFWQWSATTKVAGIANPGDVDRFFGTPDELNALTIQPPPDAGVDAGVGDDAATNMEMGEQPAGCGCRTSSSGPGALLLALATVRALTRRRRRDRCRSTC